MFCQDEILSYINENILNLSSQTSSVFKNLTPEEADAKFDRVLISCLQGYNLYLEQVPKEHLLKSIDANNSIVSNGNNISDIFLLVILVFHSKILETCQK